MMGAGANKVVRGRATHSPRGILTAPVPRHPLKRAAFLLDRARYCIIRQAYLDLFRLLDSSLPSDEKARRRWVAELRYLRSNCDAVVSLAEELEQRIAAGQDGREDATGKAKAWRDARLRDQLRVIDGGRT